MIKVNDTEKMNKYVSKHSIDEIFVKDMKSFMELFLFRKNDYVCRENEPINYLYFFVEGKAKVYITLSNGKSLLLCFYSEFKVLGDIEITNMQTASTNVQAIEDTYCIGISMEKVRFHLLDDAKFLRHICNSLGEKLNRCTRNSSINLLYPLENRLASYILAAGEIAKVADKKIIRFDENLTEIAELLGTSYRHLLRTLNILCTKRAIEKKSNYFEVVDELILRKLAADLYK